MRRLQDRRSQTSPDSRVHCLERRTAHARRPFERKNGGFWRAQFVPKWRVDSAPGTTRLEKHEPAGDIDTATVDSLKALDPNRPIREVDI